MIRRPPRSTRTDTFFPYTTLFRADPVRLLHEIRRGQERLATIADVTPQTAPPINDALDQFLTGLRIAWRDGEIRPTAGAASKPKRERRRPDPLLYVTGELHDWFLAEPLDRKSGVSGKRSSVSVDFGGRSMRQKKN